MSNPAQDFAVYQQAQGWMIIHNQQVLESQKTFPNAKPDYIDISEALKVVRKSVEKLNKPKATTV